MATSKKGHVGAGDVVGHEHRGEVLSDQAMRNTALIANTVENALSIVDPAAHQFLRDQLQRSMRSLVGIALAQGESLSLVSSILDDASDVLKSRRPRGGALSDEQAEYLIDSGAFTREELESTEQMVAGGTLAQDENRTRIRAIADTLSADEVAEILKVDASRVRHRQAKGTLYAFLTGRTRRYPTWQFVPEAAAVHAVLPGLATLVAAFPKDMHPASIQGFMTTPQQVLRDDGPNDASSPMTPVEWLASGGDPDSVVGILEGFLQS